LKDSLKDAKRIYDAIRKMRKVYSSPTSREQAIKFRSSRKWKIADATFKLFDKFGYIAILKSYVTTFQEIEEDGQVYGKHVD